MNSSFSLFVFVFDVNIVVFVFRLTTTTKPTTTKVNLILRKLVNSHLPYSKASRPGRTCLLLVSHAPSIYIQLFKIQDYYLIREIKTWLNINHITVHTNTYFIF